MEPQEQIAALQSEIELRRKAYADLEADHLKALEQIESLTKSNEALEEGNKKLLAGIAQGEEVIERLQAKLADVEKENVGLQALVVPAEEKKSLPSFEYKGKRKFEVIVPVIDIPKIGIRTALEITQDEAAQKYLVEVPGNIGTVIKEVE